MLRGQIASRGALLASLLLVGACGSDGSDQQGGPVGADPGAGGGASQLGAGGGTLPPPGGAPAGAGGGITTPVPVGGAGSVPPPVGGAGSVPPPGAGGTPSTLPPNDPNTVEVRMAPFTVPPGGEVFMCQDFDNPFAGADVAVARSESSMSTGSHHLHVYYGTDTPSREVAPCPDPFEFRPMIHLATIPNYVSEYAPGMAAKLKGTTGLRFQVHYLNTTDADLHPEVVLKLTKVEPATVTQWVGQMHFNRVAMAIPPGKGQVVSTSCKIPQTFGPIGLINAVSHMHRRGVHFIASTSTGIPLLETTAWDEAPPTSYSPPVMVNPGESINWTCTYDNDTGTTLGFGDSAVKNEMCIYIARFVSSPNGDDLTCEIPFAAGTAAATAAADH